MNILKYLNKFAIKIYYYLKFVIENIENKIHNVIIIYAILIQKFFFKRELFAIWNF